MPAPMARPLGPPTPTWCSRPAPPGKSCAEAKEHADAERFLRYVMDGFDIVVDPQEQALILTLPIDAINQQGRPEDAAELQRRLTELTKDD